LKKLLIALGTRIELERKSQKLTQTELAKQCEIARNYLSTIESGKANPSLGVLFVIAERLKVPLCKLLQEESAAFCYSRPVEHPVLPPQTWIYVPSKKLAK
jgi:putative transcriptional regulator